MAGTATFIKPNKLSKKNILTFLGIGIVIVVLVIGTAVFIQTQKKNRDTRNATRKADVNTVNDQLLLYDIHYGRFPSLANLNDSNWLKTNMPDLNQSALKDPKSGSKVVGQPTKNALSYEAKTSDGKSTCNNIDTDCFSYTLTATLEGGGIYSKTSNQN